MDSLFVSGPLGTSLKPAIGFVRSKFQPKNDVRPHIQFVITDAWGNGEFPRRIYGSLNNQREEVKFVQVILLQIKLKQHI